MLAQISGILVPPADYDIKTFEKFLFEEALPAAEKTVLTRITRDTQQSLLKGEDQVGGRTYYLWQAELDLLTDQEAIAAELINEMFTTMREQLSTQYATFTSPLTLVQPAKQA
jgi:hypothetical protein